MLRRNKNGDTIIEVMISLTILSLVLGASYASVNNSLKIGRDAEERGQASKLASSQIELIKFRLEENNVDLATIQNETFCIPLNGGSPVELGSDPPADPNADDPDDVLRYPAECKSGFFAMGVVPTLVDMNSVIQFHITVRWYSVIDGVNQVEFYYRLPNA